MLLNKCKENTNLMTGRCHLCRVGKHKNKTSSICSLMLQVFQGNLKYLDYVNKPE